MVVVVVYKRLFLRYLQSFKFRYYCRWTFGYRLYVFSVVSLSIVSIENCMMRMRMPQKTFQVSILGCVGSLRILDHYHWRWYTFKHIKAFPNICDVSLLLYNLSLMLLQYSNFCNNFSKFGDCVQLIQPISFFGKELILHPERFLESRDWKTKLLKAKVNLRCFTSAVLCFQTHFGLFKIICIFMGIVILVLETRKLDIVGSLLLWILGTTKWQSLYCVCKQQFWLRGPCELSGARAPSTPGYLQVPFRYPHYWAACPNWWTGLSWDNEERDLKRPSLWGLCA